MESLYIMLLKLNIEHLYLLIFLIDIISLCVLWWYAKYILYESIFISIKESRKKEMLD